MEIKDIKDALEPMALEIKGQFGAIEKKLEDKVNELNEDARLKGETLNELKVKVDEQLAVANRLKTTASDNIQKDWTRSQMAQYEIAEIIRQNYDVMKTESFKEPLKVKDAGTMTLGTNLTGTSVVSYVENSFMRAIKSNPRLLEIFRIIPTATGNVTFPRGNDPVGEGSFGAQTEGEAKALVDYDVTMVNVSVPFIAGRAKVSRQMLQDLPFLQAYLSMSLVEDFNQAVNARFLTTIATNATAASLSGTYTAQRFVEAIGQHGGLGLGMPNLILTTWTGWTQMLNTKPNDFSVPAATAIDANGNIRVAGVQVVPHIQVTAGRFYTINTDAFAIAQASPFQIRSTEFNSDDFDKNLISYRAEARLELLSFQPKSAVYGTLGT
jgi:hypothetical protein